MFKALKLAHLLLHVKRETNMIADVAQAAADNISALQTSLSERPTTVQVEKMIADAIAAHNEADESHPNHLVIR